MTGIEVPTFLGLHPDLCDSTRSYRSIQVTGDTVGRCIGQLELHFPGIARKLYDENGQLQYYYDILVNGEYVDRLGCLVRPVKEGDVITIIVVPVDG